MPQDVMLDEVRAMTAKGAEQVRYRGADAPDDIYSNAKIPRMWGLAYSCMQGLDRWDTWPMFADREFSWQVAGAAVVNSCEQ